MPDDVSDPRMPGSKFVLHLEGAREDETARGISAAEAVLYREGDMDLHAAMAANARRDFIMFDGIGEPINDIGEEEHRLARLREDSLGCRTRCMLCRLG